MSMQFSWIKRISRLTANKTGNHLAPFIIWQSNHRASCYQWLSCEHPHQFAPGKAAH
jgi:hypothetical protein